MPVPAFSRFGRMSGTPDVRLASSSATIALYAPASVRLSCFSNYVQMRSRRWLCPSAHAVCGPASHRPRTCRPGLNHRRAPGAFQARSRRVPCSKGKNEQRPRSFVSLVAKHRVHVSWVRSTTAGGSAGLYASARRSLRRCEDGPAHGATTSQLDRRPPCVEDSITARLAGGTSTGSFRSCPPSLPPGCLQVVRTATDQV